MALNTEMRHNVGLVLALFGAILIIAVVIIFVSSLRRLKTELEDLLETMRRKLPSDAEGAHAAWRLYLQKGGSPEALSTEELFALLATTADLDDLVVTSRVLSPERLLEAAALFSEGTRHPEALRLLQSRSLAASAAQWQGGCEQVIRVYERAGTLADLPSVLAGKPQDLIVAYARALRRLNMDETCVELLRSKQVKLPGDYRMMADALTALGRNEEAFSALSAVPKSQWSSEEYLAQFNLSLADGRLEQAKELFASIAALRPFKDDPELHYNFALRLEKSGDSAAAAHLFQGFIAAGFYYKDVLERLKNLRPSASESDSPALVGGALVKGLIGGKYELEAPIGSGGMGVVYKAMDRKLTRPVAIKVMRPELKDSPMERERFIQEARIISRLTHPCIVGIHEIIEENGEIYLVFDYVDGKPLSEILQEKTRFTLRECKEVFKHVCQAIDCAHRNNILHRDLKPSNIMIDSNGFVKVMDFGLASQVKDSISHITLMENAGTLAYMSPEQHMGKVGRPADIYALGICLYEMLTGRRPFKGPDYLSQKERMLYPAPESLVPSLPPEIGRLIARVLDPSLKKRISGAMELLKELNRLE